MMLLTDEHERHVETLVIKLGLEMSLPDMRIGELRVAARVHDIGKIAIPPDIIHKPARLNDTEYATIKSHAVLGWRMLKLAGLDKISIWVRHHHEHWDGSGYPNQLKGKEIPIEARIIAVADVYDALVGNRPYRQPLKPSNAIEELQRCSGTQFDSEVVEAFVASQA